MPLRVTKMSGAGNDFVVVGPQDVGHVPDEREAWVRRVCRRGLSVGADGVLFVRPAGDERVHVEFRNPDGGLAFCGNGSRCAARFAHLRGMAGPRMILETAAGPVPAEVIDASVRLTLPAPVDDGAAEPDIDGERVSGRRVTAGVPHFVVFVPDVDRAPLERWGPALRRHPMFGAAGVNVDLVSGSDGALRLRTWERGVEAETLACGSGAVAAAYAWYRDGGAASCRLVPRSGVGLDVRFEGEPGDTSGAILQGDARIVFEASLGPDAVEGFPPDDPDD